MIPGQVREVIPGQVLSAESVLEGQRAEMEKLAAMAGAEAEKQRVAAEARRAEDVLRQEQIRDALVAVKDVIIAQGKDADARDRRQLLWARVAALAAAAAVVATLLVAVLDLGG